jgi:hypothetical protein
MMDQQTEQKLAAWTEGKPFAISELPRLAVETIGALREVMSYRQSCRGPFAYEPAIDEQCWLSFYRRKSVIQSLCQLFFEPEIASQAYRVLRTLENPSAANPAELCGAWAIILTAFSAAEPDCKQTDSAPSIEAVLLDEGLIEKLMNQPVMQFVLRTAVPCLFVYGAFPHQLLWNVLGSDLKLAEQSVERLVRLDPRAIHHPIIRHWIESEVKLASFRVTKVRAWQRRRTPFDKPKSESYWIRVVFGLLASISELFDHRLKEPDLRELAEILQCEVPEDMIEYIRDKTSDDLSREIRRYRPYFQLPPKPDKSVFAFVREVLKVVA